MDEQELQKLLARYNQDLVKEITRLINELRKAPVLSPTQIKRVNDELKHLTKNLNLNNKDEAKLTDLTEKLISARLKEIEATKGLNNKFYSLYRMKQQLKNKQTLPQALLSF